MDILGAIALATAPPLASVIHQKAVNSSSTVLTKIIWRQIYGVAVWMIAIMFILIYFGRSLFNLPYEKDTQTTDGCARDPTTGIRP